jgi:hypothetical protein
MNSLRTRCCRDLSWPAAFVAVLLASRVVAATPVFTLKSFTLLQEGGVSPRVTRAASHILRMIGIHQPTGRRCP